MQANDTSTSETKQIFSNFEIYKRNRDPKKVQNFINKQKKQAIATIFAAQFFFCKKCLLLSAFVFAISIKYLYEIIRAKTKSNKSVCKIILNQNLQSVQFFYGINEEFLETDIKDIEVFDIKNQSQSDSKNTDKFEIFLKIKNKHDLTVIMDSVICKIPNPELLNCILKGQSDKTIEKFIFFNENLHHGENFSDIFKRHPSKQEID